MSAPVNCEKCGNAILPTADFCENCGQPIPKQPVEPVAAKLPAMETPAPEIPIQKEENVLTGIVGALIGAAIGGGAILLLSQLGFVASISGFILAVCTLKGYELLGGRLTTRGIVICIALMLVTPYIADRIDWAIVIMNTYKDIGITFGQAFASVHALVVDGAIETSTYVTTLLMLYGFTALGAFSTVRGLFKKNKNPTR